MGLGDALIYVNCRNVLNLDRYFYPDSLFSCRPLKRVFQWPSKYQDPLCILIKKFYLSLLKPISVSVSCRYDKSLDPPPCCFFKG